MATKQVSLRVGQQTLDNLRYLGILMRQSDAQIVTEWINTLADTIRIMADQANPALGAAPYGSSLSKFLSAQGFVP